MENTRQTDITVLQTGGTIDKDYPRTTGGYAFEISNPATSRIFQRAKTTLKVDEITVCQKDSQEITAEIRQDLLKQCQKSKCDKILITHGTDTMIETAAYLASKLLDTNQMTTRTIILTGASKPETFKDSDADFNVGVAVGALQCLNSPGVYVAMNGCVYQWDKVSRDMETGQFVHKTVNTSQ